MRLAGQCLKVEPGRLRELAEADKDGRLVVLPEPPKMEGGAGNAGEEV